jgi:hypothetical protein
MGFSSVWHRGLGEAMLPYLPSVHLSHLNHRHLLSLDSRGLWAMAAPSQSVSVPTERHSTSAVRLGQDRLRCVLESGIERL